jgi:hypothetical protein
MSVDTGYWTFIGIALIAALATGVPVMVVTRKLLRSFLISLAANSIVMISASVWLYWVTTEPLRHTIGKLVFYAIAFVNIEILIFFFLASLKKPQDARPKDTP